MAYFTSSCDLFNDNGDDLVLWSTLSAYEKLGTLWVNQISNLYPSEVGIFLVYDVALYKLIYNTETPQGEPFQASGIVLVPQRDNPAAAVLFFQETFVWFLVY